MPDLHDQHNAWHDDLDMLEVSAELFEALRFIDGVITGRTLPGTSAARPAAGLQTTQGG